MSVHTTYKFMVMDHRNHLIVAKDDVFESDEQACERARAVQKESKAFAVEVWESARFICRADGYGLHFSPPAAADQ